MLGVFMVFFFVLFGPVSRPSPGNGPIQQGTSVGVVFRGHRERPLRKERAGEGRREDDSEKDLKTG